MRHKYLLEATYADGFVYNGTEADVSLFDPNRNHFYDVIERKLEPQHGRLCKWAIVGDGCRFEYDLTKYPADTIRPILFRHMELDLPQDGSQPDMANARVMKWDFGFQYSDSDGVNYQEVINLS